MFTCQLSCHCCCCCTVHHMAVFRFGGSSPWYSKRVEQFFPATEAEASLYTNGSSKAEPTNEHHPTLFYVINQNSTNRCPGGGGGCSSVHTFVPGSAAASLASCPPEAGC